MIRHVVSCHRCWATVVETVEQLGDKPLLATDPRDALAALVKGDAWLRSEALKARAWWADIRGLSPAVQIKKIRSVAALRDLPVFEAILSEARAVGRSDPYLGESTAWVAFAVADHLPEPRFSEHLKSDLRGEALTLIANCRRIKADWPGSTEALAEAQQYLSRGTGDPALEAGLLSIHCSLCTDTGRIEEALALVRRAVKIFGDIEDWHGLAHNRVLEAGCLMAADQPVEAIERANAAIERIPPHEIRLQSLARFIIIECLVLLARPQEALSRFMEGKPIFDQAGDLGTRLRAASLEARVLDGLGCNRESEKLFRDTVKVYFDHELYKEGFITLLTLFECFCRRGALGKAAALCEAAIAATSEAGAACNDQIRRAWEELLAAVRVRQLSETELLAARQYLVRNWSVPRGGALALQRIAVAPARETAALEPPPPPPVPPAEAGPNRFQAAREEYDRQLITAALEHAGGNISEASRLLDMSRTTLKARMRLYGL